eukprot:scaffold162439_cov18-Prasinocladus_malaysianus.AAC.1
MFSPLDFAFTPVAQVKLSDFNESRGLNNTRKLDRHDAEFQFKSSWLEMKDWTARVRALGRLIFGVVSIRVNNDQEIHRIFAHIHIHARLLLYVAGRMVDIDHGKTKLLFLNLLPKTIDTAKV